MKKKKRTKYEMSRIQTRLLKKDVPREFWPLYDHMFRLAADSHRRGYYKRAGRELRHARSLTKYSSR